MIGPFAAPRSLGFKVVLLMAFIILMVGFIFYWPLAVMAFDVSMYIVAAQLILEGAMPYVDIIDINPPLVLYIHLFIVWISQILRLPPLEAYDVGLLITLLLVAVFIFRSLRHYLLSAPFIAISFLMASLHALIAIQYGQREHLFMTLFIPYVLIRSGLQKKKSALSWLITVFTGLLAFLKPGFLAILVTFELMQIRTERQISKKQAILLFVPGALYLLHFLFLPKEMSHAFWWDLIPMVWQRYGTMGLSPTELFKFWGFTIFCYLFLAALFLKRGRRGDASHRFILLNSVGACAITAIFSAVLQGKGWEYHLIPAQVLLFVGLPVLLESLFVQPMSLSKKFLFGIPISFLLFQHMYHQAKNVKVVQKRFVEQCGNDELKELGFSGAHIVIFSSQPCYSYPIFYEQNFKPGTRYVSLFPLAFFNFTHERSQMFKTRFPTEADFSSDEKTFIDNLKRDLITKKPDIIIFPKLLMPEEFDPYRYAQSTGLLNIIEPNYQMVRDNEKWRVFRRQEAK